MQPDTTPAPRNRGGFALLAVLIVVVAVGILAAGAVTVVGNSSLVNAYESRRTELETLADAGLELARARLNADPALFPATGYRTLESAVAPRDASGAVIPGVRRSTYVGPIGQVTGQYGIFGSVISMVEAGNIRVVRRGDLLQESFARFAYFTDIEPSNIAFGGGDQISGPVHSNDFIRIYDSGATFRGPGGVTTAQRIEGRQYGTFLEGYTERAPRIDLPSVAELTRLRTLAQSGGSAFTAPSGGGAYDTRMRIEFIAIDLNGDGALNGEDEGFFRVYRTTTSTHHWTTASRPGSGWASSPNCGSWSGGVFTRNDPGSGNATQRLNRLRQGNNSRCYLGGSDSLFNGFRATDGYGEWMRRPFALNGILPAALTSRPDFEYLFPLGRGFNPEFKGVIHVTGKVAVSGVLRGRVTLAATDRILIADDITYATQGAGGCQDILGLFGGNDVAVVDNALNSPQQIANGEPWRTFDSTADEFIQAVILTLGTFHVENYGSGATSAQPCGGISFGRGCLFLTGGIIQRTRGPVGTSAGTGYVKRYAYDACAYSDPPPYFPTTGHFGRSRWYEIDPTGFDVSTFYARMSGG